MNRNRPLCSDHITITRTRLASFTEAETFGLIDVPGDELIPALRPHTPHMQTTKVLQLFANCNKNFKSVSAARLPAGWQMAFSETRQEQITFHVSQSHLVQNDPYLSSLLIAQPRLTGNKQALEAEIRSLVSSRVTCVYLAESR